jgi:pyruvate ferredoxin oxidoreductase gamma subunit
MFQVRIHGRGGQGVVTAAELLSVAAFAEGRHAQAVPSFGSERTGAPVVSFCRIDDKPIRLREPIVDPDCVVIADATLLGHIDVLNGLRADGYLLLNSAHDWAASGLADVADRLSPGHGQIVPATRLALAHVGRPVPNAALLGAFAAMTGLITLPSVVAAIRERFPARIAEGNVAAATEAYEQIQLATAEAAHATAD